jgi:hypothetical protein
MITTIAPMIVMMLTGHLLPLIRLRQFRRAPSVCGDPVTRSPLKPSPRPEYDARADQSLRTDYDPLSAQPADAHRDRRAHRLVIRL